MTTERRTWEIVVEFFGTPDEADRFSDWIVEETPEEFVPVGEGSCGLQWLAMEVPDDR